MAIKTTKQEASFKLSIPSRFELGTTTRLRRLCPCCKTRDLYHMRGQVEHIQCYSCGATWFKVAA